MAERRDKWIVQMVKQTMSGRGTCGHTMSKDCEGIYRTHIYIYGEVHRERERERGS